MPPSHPDHAILGRAVKRREEWKRQALQLARALRRCADDSRDLRAGRAPDPVWVEENIRMADTALAELDQLRNSDD